MKIYIVVLLIVSTGLVHAQQILQVSIQRFSSTRIYEIYKYEVLEYKLKGEFRFRKHKIIHMQDSTILFDNGSEIKLAQLKAIRLRRNIHLIQTMQAVFIGGGIGFITLNTVNNLITHTTPVYNEKAALISVALLTTGFLIRELDLKRIRITKRKNLKIRDMDYHHLNSTDAD